MDTMEKVVVTESNSSLIDELTIVEGKEEDLFIISSYVELTRNLTDIYQWYDIINYNYEMFSRLIPDGDIIALNSHTISFLGAGKSVVDSMQTCIVNAFPDGKEKKLAFEKDVCSKEYDGNFSYRFLARLRDYTQHSQIPISQFKGSPCFDLHQIFDTPHFSFNKAIKREAEAKMREVADKTGDTLTLSCYETACSYMCSLYSIIKSFMDLIYPALIEKRNALKELIQQEPDIVHHVNHPELEGWIFYLFENDESNLHCFSSNDDPLVECIKYKNAVNNRLKVEKRKWKDVKKNSIPI